MTQVVGSIGFNPNSQLGRNEMTHDLIRKISEADAWDNLARAIEEGDKVEARKALTDLRRSMNFR